jgi:hypothetical protein
LYGCETWSIALEEEHTFREFEKRMLRKTFDLKRQERTMCLDEKGRLRA